MRAIVPYIFWPWFATSCFILLRRRVSTGGWKPMPSDDDIEPLPEFPPPPPRPEMPSFAESRPADDPAEPASASTDAPEARVDDAESMIESTEAAAPLAVDTEPRPASRTLADALTGIAMPADLSPLIGTAEMNPREIAFFTNGHAVASVGTAIGDELERLGFALTPLDDATIDASRGADLVRARIMGGDVTHPDVMKELHPSAPVGAVVVELKLA
ncbi:MAG: hypothetical protein AAF548_16610 [Actinomycetota bacterium]